MALLSTSQLTKSFGTDVIFSGVSFEIQKNDRVGLVGINGSGKTTLFKVLMDEYSADSGEIYKARDCVIGYMEQHVCRDLHRSAYHEVLTVFSHLSAMEERLDTINKALQGRPENPQALLEEQFRLNEQFDREGGLTYKSRARSTLLGLGFTDEQMGAPIGVLSGGQKAKLQLAKMLLSGANLLLLDEPTNHLDIPSVEWLENFLSGYSGAYLVISHDRFFLDHVTNRTFEMEYGRLTPYKGNYSTYLTLKEEGQLTAQRVYENTTREIKRLQAMIEQQKRFNQERNYRTIASKMKSIERLQKTLVRPTAAPDSIHFSFGASQRGGNDVLMAENLSLAFDGKPLFENVNLSISRQERVFLLGPNGCGKTSLLKILLRQYQPQSGNVRFGAGIDVGYYDQLQTSLTGQNEGTVIDAIWDLHPQMTETQVRSALAVFLFKGEDVFKPVAALSGGERARVLLLRLMLSKANFLLLDEPTNHLDIDSCEALEDALFHYDGTLLIVSHDRYLINKLADRIYYLEDGGITEYLGNYDDFLQARREKEEAARQNEEKAAPKINLYKQRKEQEAELRRMRTAVRKTEERIEETDEAMAACAQALQEPDTAADFEKAMELSARMEELRRENDRLMAEWEALSAQLEEKEKAALS
ncbi:MAG: ABC-F family ATP-binding cassette domain-containing protein [Clostridia bacterium]|nr:ABC-F family ATP-binding cassette domain-containing protein [Clostridia bacterium]MDY5558911.1 ABC-F family ATP-binding cassette domain-containing protein [Candidatus Heritagella sp.]